jgi:hypothetical protein
MEMHSGNCQLRVIFRLFSGYNRGAYGFTQHILVRNAHAQAISRLLGGFSRLPAPLPGRAAIARPRQSIRRRLTCPYVLTLSSACMLFNRSGPKASTRNKF